MYGILISVNGVVYTSNDHKLAVIPGMYVCMHATTNYMPKISTNCRLNGIKYNMHIGSRKGGAIGLQPT